MSVWLIAEKAEAVGARRQNPIAIITGISAAIGLFTTVQGARAEEEAQDRLVAEQRRANKARERQSELEQQRERRRQIRAARVQAGETINAAAVQGVQQSSITSGTAGGIQTELSGNLGFLSQSSANVQELNAAIGQQQKALSDISTAQSIQGLGQTIFSNSGRIGRLGETAKTIFTGTKEE